MRWPGEGVERLSLDCDFDRGDLVSDLQLLNHVEPLGDAAELVVDTAGGERGGARPIREHYEELRPADPRPARGHAYRTRLPGCRVGLVRELVRRSTGSVAERIAALDDELGDHPVEGE